MPTEGTVEVEESRGGDTWICATADGRLTMPLAADSYATKPIDSGAMMRTDFGSNCDE